MITIFLKFLLFSACETRNAVISKGLLDSIECRDKVLNRTAGHRSEATL